MMLVGNPEAERGTMPHGHWATMPLGAQPTIHLLHHIKAALKPVDISAYTDIQYCSEKDPEDQQIRTLSTKLRLR